MVAPAPEPIAPFEPIDIPELTPPAPEPTVAPAPNPAPVAAPAPTEPAPAPIAPRPTPIVEETSTQISFAAPAGNLNTQQVKAAALRDLIPLLDRLNMTPSQKFNICRNIFEDLRDYTVLEQAYRAASEITDTTERAEALLYLVESIDKM